VATLADKDASIVQHHARVQEGEVAEEVANLALTAAMGTVDNLLRSRGYLEICAIKRLSQLYIAHLDHVALLHSVLLGIQGYGISVLPLFLQGRRLHRNHLAVHVQHLNREKGIIILG